MDFGMPFLLECPSIESACALCAKLCLQFVELNLSFPLCNLDALTAQRLNSLCAQYGLYFTFHLDEELAPCAFDSRVRAAYVDCALRAITLARPRSICIGRAGCTSPCPIALPICLKTIERIICKTHASSATSAPRRLKATSIFA